MSFSDKQRQYPRGPERCKFLGLNPPASDTRGVRPAGLGSSSPPGIRSAFRCLSHCVTRSGGASLPGAEPHLPPDAVRGGAVRASSCHHREPETCSSLAIYLQGTSSVTAALPSACLPRLQVLWVRGGGVRDQRCPGGCDVRVPFRAGAASPLRADHRILRRGLMSWCGASGGSAALSTVAETKGELCC